VWHGGNQGEPELLASCYRRSLDVAAEAGARSIAFPAISTGIFGYPAPAAADIAVSTVRSCAAVPGLRALDVVRLVAFDAETHRLYEDALSGCS
jgi:O-acetyl-ADP-ribose deacetylase (regulator of RNase III)